MFHVNTSWWFYCRLWMLANKKAHNLHNQIGHMDDHVVDKSKNSNDVMQKKKSHWTKWEIGWVNDSRKISSLNQWIERKSRHCFLSYSNGSWSYTNQTDARWEIWLKSLWFLWSLARMGKKAKNRAKQQWKTHRERKNDCKDHNIYK